GRPCSDGGFDARGAEAPEARDRSGTPRPVLFGGLDPLLTSVRELGAGQTRTVVDRLVEADRPELCRTHRRVHGPAEVQFVVIQPLANYVIDIRGLVRGAIESRGPAAVRVHVGGGQLVDLVYGEVRVDEASEHQGEELLFLGCPGTRLEVVGGRDDERRELIS